MASEGRYHTVRLDDELSVRVKLLAKKKGFESFNGLMRWLLAGFAENNGGLLTEAELREALREARRRRRGS